MKKLLLILLVILSTAVFGQSKTTAPKYLTTSNFESSINTGVVVVEFTAPFANSYKDWNKIKDCKYYRVDIEKYPALKDKYKIRALPTVILFNNGTKEDMWRGNIMLELELDPEEIQEAIEDLLSNKF